MKKINNIKHLREILRNLINTQARDEIKNFNSLYDYSSITDMSYLWSEIEKNISKEIDWEDIKFPTLDMKNVKIRQHTFMSSSLYEINLINTYNIENFDYAFCETKNLEKISLDLKACEELTDIFNQSNIKECELKNTQNIINFSYAFRNTEKLEKVNDLYLDNCEDMTNRFRESKIEEVNLYNTGKIKEWFGCFWDSNIEKIELDMGEREICEHMFSNCKKLKNLNLKNCKNIKSIEGFIQGCKNLDYLEINVSNMEKIRNFIDKKNNLKYLKLIGLENQKQPKKNIKEEFNKLFSNKEQEKNLNPHIELVKKNTIFNIIGDNNSSIRLEKKEKKEKIMNIRKEKIEEKKEKIKSQKEKICEINL